MIEVHDASLTSQGVQHRVLYLDGQPSRYQPCPKGLTSVNRREPVFSLWLEPFKKSTVQAYFSIMDVQYFSHHVV